MKKGAWAIIAVVLSVGCQSGTSTEAVKDSTNQGAVDSIKVDTCTSCQADTLVL